MASYKIDNIDQAKKHVTFTVTLDDNSTYTDTRCDLPIDSKEALTTALEQYTLAFAAGKAQEKAQALQGTAPKEVTDLVGKAQQVSTAQEA